MPTDTEITLTFNRVDANGSAQDSSEVERITGTIVGSNLTSYTRGTDGTTEQAHAAGTVIEYIWNSQDLNDIVDGILVSHSQDGGHKADAIDAITEIAAALKSGSDTTLVTGTAGTDTYVSKWNADGDLVDGYAFLDEDDMASDSATSIASQQSIKAYADGVAKNESAIEIVIDGGGSELSTGVALDVEIPYNCTINGVKALANESGSVVVDIWKDTYANFPPTDADSITASAPVTISTATKSEDTTLTGWTTSLSEGDILRFNVDSVTTITRVTVSLDVTKS